MEIKPTVKLTGTAKSIFEDAANLCHERQAEVKLADVVFLTAWAAEMGKYFDVSAELEEAGHVLPFKNGSQEGHQGNPLQKVATTALANAKKAFASISKPVQSVVAIEGAEEELAGWTL